MPSSVVGAAVGGLTGSTLAGGVASGLTGLAMGGLGGSRGNGVAPFTNINAGQLKSGVDTAGRFTVTSGKARTALINSIIDKYKNQSGYLTGLAPQVSSVYDSAISGTQDLLNRVNPAYGDITKSRVAAINNAKQASVSDLRSILARRRVLGSSFADDTQKRTEAEYAQKEADARATSLLEEMDATAKLIDTNLQYKTSQISGVKSLLDEAFNMNMAADQTQLDEWNTMWNAANGLLSSFQRVQQANAAADYENALAAGKTLAASLSSMSGLGKEIGTKIGGIWG